MVFNIISNSFRKFGRTLPDVVTLRLKLYHHDVMAVIGSSDRQVSYLEMAQSLCVRSLNTANWEEILILISS